MQTPEGIIKMKKTIIEKYGLTEDSKSALHTRVGAIGGSKPTLEKKGFAAMTPEKRIEAGRKGGTISRRPKH